MASDNFVDNRLLCGVTHDLAEELFHFANHKPWQSGLYSKLLVKAEDLRVVLIAMHAGAKMKEHHTDGTTTIQVLQGALRLQVQGKSQDLRVGQVLTLAPRVKHDVEASEDSAFLLTIAWPSSETLQSLPPEAMAHNLVRIV
jgi:quercetin dioxygenase-like cupin family protein